MKYYRKKLFTLTSVLFLAQLQADTITLTDGTELDGKILEENGDEVIIEIKVTDSIKDRKTFKKSEIKAVVETLDDKKPFADIAALSPSADRLTVLDYQKNLKKIDKFIKDYPTSKHVSAAEKIKATLTDEMAKVKEGSIKLVGEWIEPKQQESNAYDINAMVAFANMKDQIDAGNAREAVISYEKMSNETPDSSYQAEADQLALKLFKGYQAIVKSQLEQAPFLIETREKTLTSLDNAVAHRMKEEIDRTNEVYLESYERAKADGVKWIPTSKYHPKQLEELALHLNTASKSLETKLSQKKADEFINLGEVYKDAWEATESKNLEKAKTTWEKFKSPSAKPADKYIETIQTRIEKLEKELKDKEEAAAKKAAEEVEAARIEAENIASGKTFPPKTNDPTAPTTKNPAPQGISPATPSSSKDQPIEEEVIEDEGGGMMNILYGVIALALVAILVMFFSRSKKKKK